jgi:hypothetical protein
LVHDKLDAEADLRESDLADVELIEAISSPKNNGTVSRPGITIPLTVFTKEPGQFGMVCLRPFYLGPARGPLLALHVT